MTRSSHKDRNVTAAILIASAGLLSACQAADNFQMSQIVGGSTRQMRDVEPVGGFLPSPSLLQPGGPGRAALMYQNSSVNLARYNTLILDPVTLWTGPNSPVSKVPEQERLALANTFTADLNQALGAKCRMTQQGGPGVARIRIALVDTTTANAALNTVATYTPYVSAAYGAASYGLNKGVSYFAGTATVEGYITDTANGAVLWQVVDKRGGTTAMIKNTLDTQLDVHHAFEAWSKNTVAALQQAGMCNGT